MSNSLNMKRCIRTAFVAASLAVLPFGAVADDVAFAPGWILSSDNSALRFQSVKNSTKVESSKFATYTGSIDETGMATIKIALDSVDTNVDLRNVRMRFLMFETFKYPEAVVTMQIAPEVVADLKEVRRKVLMMPYTITLHGVTAEKEAEIAITLLDDNKVSVTSATPISLPVADFDLADGLTKLEEAAKVTIIPSATVSFDFTFERAASPEGFNIAIANQVIEANPETAALEEDGDLSVEACKGRFEIMSRTDNIYFTSGGWRLQEESSPLLASISEIVKRCPSLVVTIAGHTDSDGSLTNNQRLSEARAQAVADYLKNLGVEEHNLVTVGYGEAQPAFPNDTPANKKRNRRIEFVARAAQSS